MFRKWLDLAIWFERTGGFCARTASLLNAGYPPYKTWVHPVSPLQGKGELQVPRSHALDLCPSCLNSCSLFHQFTEPIYPISHTITVISCSSLKVIGIMHKSPLLWGTERKDVRLIPKPGKFKRVANWNASTSAGFWIFWLFEIVSLVKGWKIIHLNSVLEIHPWRHIKIEE